MISQSKMHFVALDAAWITQQPVETCQHIKRIKVGKQEKFHKAHTK
jgi:hypothetical protein